MTIITSHHVPKESFLLACSILEQDVLSITYMAATHYADEMNKLIALNAFEVGSLDYCFNNEGEEEDLHFQDNKPGYFDKNGNFIRISYNNFTSFNLKPNWVPKIISNDFEISYYHSVKEVVPNLLWQIGVIHNNTPLFFARRVLEEGIFTRINQELVKRRSKNTGVILVSCNKLPDHFHPEIAGNKVILIKDCLIHNNKNFHIDHDIIATTINSGSVKLENKDSQQAKEGFFSNYRTAYINGKDYSFTQKQSDIIQALHQHGGKLNKHQLIDETASKQEDVYRIFRSKNKKHPAWNILIKNDGKGNYWLDY